MPLILGANSVSGYNVANSLRFNSGSSDYLSRTYGTPTNNLKYTKSFWIKRSGLSDIAKGFIWCNTTNSNTDYFYFNPSDQILVGNGSTPNTTAVFRDVSAWYHCVMVFDSANATAANRLILYVNNVQQTLSGTITLNSTGGNQSGVTYTIGYQGGVSRYLDAYMSEIYMIDGQALTPSSFGETDTDTGIWKPKAYTGSYGTNGFYLKFANSASLGTDSSGNGNTFTVNNLTSVDQSTDTPTNNFCTLNPLAYSGSQMSQGNLDFSATGSWTAALSTINPSTGKWYAEFKITQTNLNGVYIGVTPSNIYWASGSIRALSNSGTWYGSDGAKYVDGTGTSYGATFTTNDIIGVALDKTNNTIIFYKNGSSQGSLNLTSSTNSGDVSLAEDLYPYPSSVQANFGSPPYSANSYTDGAGYGNFSYAVPSGYYALNTKNLANFG